MFLENQFSFAIIGINYILKLIQIENSFIVIFHNISVLLHL